VRNEHEFKTKLEREAKQRVPFVRPLWRTLARDKVPAEDWEHYVEPRMRREMLCQACYTQIKAWVDAAEQAAE
jgi:hypothetical protein